jgi:hypothetical protein
VVKGPPNGTGGNNFGQVTSERDPMYLARRLGRGVERIPSRRWSLAPIGTSGAADCSSVAEVRAAGLRRRFWGTSENSVCPPC